MPLLMRFLQLWRRPEELHGIESCTGQDRSDSTTYSITSIRRDRASGIRWAHVGYGPDAFYNGATERDVAAGRRNGVEHWPRRGIVGRVVVLDMVRTFVGEGRR
jgi:hypothetical protein